MTLAKSLGSRWTAALQTPATRWAIALLLIAGGCRFLAAQPGAAAEPAPLPSGTLAAGDPATHDGQHDFDFNFGTWHTHIRRVLNPLAGGTQTIELDGSVTVRQVWGGRAQLEEIETDGPSGHWEGTTLFLYNPAARQWSQTFANSKTGVLNTPLIGAFRNGVGELYSQDTFEGRSILVRGQWSDIQPDSHRYTESYSDDGGATWHPAFLAQLTRKRP